MNMSPRNGNIFRVTGLLLGGIHRSPVDSSHKGQWRGALMFPLICTRTNGWANNRDARELKHHRTHYDVAVMVWGQQPRHWCYRGNGVLSLNVFMYVLWCSYKLSTAMVAISYLDQNKINAVNSWLLSQRFVSSLFKFLWKQALFFINK